MAHHFQNSEPPKDENPFKQSSGWTPPAGKNPFLDTFIHLTTEEICNKNKITLTNKNLRKEEILALDRLRKNQNIVIKPADKGGAVVVWDKTEYLKEANRQLSNHNHYRLEPSDSTSKNTRDINNFLNFCKEKNLLPKETTEYLKTKNCRTPIFYLLPKIHKKNNPGRPIISQTNGPTEKISAFVDFHLKPLAQKVPSYIRDTADFLSKLQNLSDLPEKYYIVTIDVTALYTSIPTREGILASKHALESRENKEPQTWIILRLIQFILTRNNFRFDKNHYTQIQGTAMGTKMAPNYAVIFMDYIERKYPDLCTLQPTVWWRYIDDIFMIWPHSREDLDSFINGLNSFHDTIKFTADISETQGHYLDVFLYRDSDGQLQTTIYTKPTDAHQYLSYNSCHPTHQKKSIPWGQALRLRRICSTVEEYNKHSSELLKNLLDRGYPTKIVEEAIKNARSISREQLIQPKEKQEKTMIPFVVTFNPRNPPIKSILMNNKHILQNAPNLQHLANKNITVAYRKARSLRDILVRADISEHKKDTGSKACGHCASCKHMKPSTSIRSFKNKKEYRIQEDLNCQNHNAIYVIQCKTCGMQYVGQTSNTVNERIRGHTHDILSKNQHKPVSQHFNKDNHSINDVTVIILQTTPSDVNTRLRIEESWIRLLGTQQPSGMNIKQ